MHNLFLETEFIHVFFKVRRSAIYGKFIFMNQSLLK